MILMGCVCHIAYITAEKAIGTFVKSVEFDIDYYPPPLPKKRSCFLGFVDSATSFTVFVG